MSREAAGCRPPPQRHPPPPPQEGEGALFPAPRRVFPLTPLPRAELPVPPHSSAAPGPSAGAGTFSPPLPLSASSRLIPTRAAGLRVGERKTFLPVSVTVSRYGRAGRSFFPGEGGEAIGTTWRSCHGLGGRSSLCERLRGAAALLSASWKLPLRSEGGGGSGRERVPGRERAGSVGGTRHSRAPSPPPHRGRAHAARTAPAAANTTQTDFPPPPPFFLCRWSREK